MKEITNVIKTLFHLQTQIHLLVETLNEIGNNYKTLQKIKFDNFFDQRINLEDATHTLISNYAIIMFCSFLDEYEKYFTPLYLKDCKGLTYSNVCVVINDEILKQFHNQSYIFKSQITKNKFYVACSRSKGNLYFVSDKKVKKYKS